MIGLSDPIPIIGKDFQNYFPTALLVLCFFNLFDIWSKFMICIGLEELTFSEVLDEERSKEG